MRRYTTLYLDDDILRQLKIMAAMTDRGMSKIAEEAIQKYLQESGYQEASYKASD